MSSSLCDTIWLSEKRKNLLLLLMEGPRDIEQIKTSFNVASLDFQNTDSLGLQLVTALVDQINGSIELNTSKGTEFKIIFPL